MSIVAAIEAFKKSIEQEVLKSPTVITLPADAYHKLIYELIQLQRYASAGMGRTKYRIKLLGITIENGGN